MPRRPRVIPSGSVVHVVNRGNERRRLFDRREDYLDFLEVLDRSLRRKPMRLLAYGLMPNHWHLLLWPEKVMDTSRFLHQVTTTHASRFRYVSGTGGAGHLYQGRFRSTLVSGPLQYLRTVRYVEANPLRAHLVDRAEAWPWTSLAERLGQLQRIVAGPVPLPSSSDWAQFVNEAVLDDDEGSDPSPSDLASTGRGQTPHIFGAGSIR